MAASGSPKSEIRFAVVMYGGVSLAIYMNGIAHELLRMVRATATGQDGVTPLIPSGMLDRVETVYRKIAYRLAGATNVDEMLVRDAALERKFTIDVISGTSAGGINGIFLAKALATGLGMDDLKNLWIAEGDAALLINDSRSVKDTVLKVERSPQSLFNSRRMYQKLLEAFEKMDDARQPGSGNSPSAYVRELDLFVTTTDILGLILPIELTDSTVYERRHRNVFRFSSSDTSQTTWNDFVKENNPMLAFAARSTSSFPFAFEPVMLSDIDEVLRRKDYGEEFLSSGDRWKRFFRGYPDKPASGCVSYRNRPFGDGGYLDNKPFSYAVETISARHSDLPVERKLLYIEPVPDHPESDPEKNGRPNAIENSIAALLKLPRYETIRGDLEKILERNRLLERIEQITINLDADKLQSGWVAPYVYVYRAWQKKIEKGEDAGAEPFWAKPGLNDREWGMLDMADMTLRKGPGYAAYQRLEIESVTDDFGTLLARVAGFDEQSDTARVFRNLVRAWREERFVRYRGSEYDTDRKEDAHTEMPPRTMNTFLHWFDLTFPLRRLRFLKRRIDRFYAMDTKELSKDLEKWLDEPVPAGSDDWISSFRVELLSARKDALAMQSRLIEVGRELRSRFRPREGTDGKDANPLYDLVAELVDALSGSDDVRLSTSMQSGSAKQTGDDRDATFRPVIDFFLGSGRSGGKSAQQASEEVAAGFLEGNKKVIRLLDRIAIKVKNRLTRAIEESDGVCRKALCIDETVTKNSDFGATAARSVLGNTYRSYSDYDMVLFPILYGTAADEGTRIDVSRISPEDATFLVDERKDRLKKLAGTALGNFGAFMEERWRRNDIMWGQLDGAERIIRALLPDAADADSYIGEAHAAIVLDTMREMGPDESKDLLVEAFMRPASGKPVPESFVSFIRKLKAYTTRMARSRYDYSQAFRDIDERELRDHYLRVFRSNHVPEPEAALKNAARATTVTGKILSGIADQYGVAGKGLLAVMMRAGTLLWWLVEASVPRSMTNLVFKHWMQLLYLFETLLLILGLLFVNPGVQRLGLTILALTGAVHLTVLWLRDLLLFKNKWALVFKSLGTALILVLLLSGIASIVAVSGLQQEWWGVVEGVHKWFVSMNLWD
ncbi:MAG: patatin-like protein [Chlorobium sp.]|uniref:patatin-like protein n=1 Tax=Chlorobium sp. TaxID=1095 RepID=UPI0025B8EBE1|nr:patatin-like protein [Chlorobium sp.]MCF8382046.1 patatin-like protein [Chlorobium sp.]